jgi:hypothetical protein
MALIGPSADGAFPDDVSGRDRPGNRAKGRLFDGGREHAAAGNTPPRIEGIGLYVIAKFATFTFRQLDAGDRDVKLRINNS